MATEIMYVEAGSFPNSPLQVKNQDSVHFVQQGTGAPTTVTVPSTLFQDGVTTCTVDPNAQGPNLYLVVGTDDDYEVEDSDGDAETPVTGTIIVIG